MMRMARIAAGGSGGAVAIVSALASALVWGPLAARAAEPPSAAAVLESRCVSCHNPKNKKGGLDLTTRKGLLKGGNAGPSVAAGDADASLLYRVAAHLEEPHMPLREPKLPEAEIAALAAWIKAGAAYERTLAVPESGDKSREGPWSFRPLRVSEPPAVRDAGWCRTAVDRFILAALEAKGIAPNRPADRRTLIRRATFDLIGLPPAPDEIEAFVADPAATPDAYARLVDRLLDSPHFGERWGRHWLDVARYADSAGYESDDDRPGAHHYRDFVIRAFNRDMPFDRFVKWQLAGDEYAPDDPEARAATGFCTVGPVVETKNGTPAEREKYRYDELDDIVSTVGSAFLGLTVGCARCHDHKFDPVPTRDYYALAAAFATSKRTETPMAPAERVAEHARQMREYEARLAPVRARREEFRKAHGDPKKYPTELSGEWDALNRAVAEVERTRPAPLPTAPTLTDASAVPAKAYLLARGEPTHKAGEITLGFVGALTGGAPVERWWKRPRAGTGTPAASTFQRTAVAEWLTDSERGAGALVARVLVNRLWHHHFGDGLVRTPNDFGLQGEPPTHPELLDWLAGELIAGGWKLKRLHRLIMTSAVYMQDGAWDEARARVDVDNRLLWRKRPMRLEAEAVRDAILAVGGRLDRTMFGPAVKPALPPEVAAGRNKDSVPRPAADGPGQWRRTVYLFVKRSLPTPMLEVLDAPNSGASCGRRSRSTVATQGLLMLNDPFVRRQAALFAERVAAETGETAATKDRIRRAYLLALGRPPQAEELSRADVFLRSRPDAGKGLADFCHVLLTLNEFVYAD
jgi:mono/diheme cytochrome c family protein